MICRVFEVMFQTTLEYPRLDDKEVGLLNFGSMRQDWLQAAWGIHSPALCSGEDVHESVSHALRHGG